MTSSVAAAAGSGSKLLRPFIHGKYVSPSSTTTSNTSTSTNKKYELRNPANNEIIYHYYECDKIQIEHAIESSVIGQQIWYNEYSPNERCTILRKAADIISSRVKEFSELESLDTGRPISETSSYDVLSATDCLYYYSGIGSSVGGTTYDLPKTSTNGNKNTIMNNWGYTKREPLGVTVGIGAWNYPLQCAIWKSAPSLTFGNSMIYKPSEETPLTTLLLSEVYTEAGIPNGVFNVVLGTGIVTGKQLVQNSNISKVSFTGSLQTGRQVYRDAAYDMKHVTMELGGKSPLIVFEDCNLENAVSATMIGNWYSNGQVCSNCTRVYVHSSIIEEFTQRLVERTKQLTIGNPMNPNTDIGPMITEKQLNKVIEYINIGQNIDKATLLYGGERIVKTKSNNSDNTDTEELDCNGYYITPAIFTNCTDDMTIVKEEIFGMVCCILSFDTEEEVIQRANNTQYGLSAGVFTNNIQRGHRVISKLHVGTTWINNYNVAPIELPWGGYKLSGIGRENGLAGVESWTQLKSVYVEMNDGILQCPYK